MQLGTGVGAAGILAVLLMAAPGQGRAGGEWPDGPQWFQKLERPDNDKHPYRDSRSRSCCGAGDVVKTKFKVEGGDDKYPDDRRYAWITEQWIPILPEKIVQDYASDGRPYLFMAAGAVLCFVKPKGGT